MHAVEMILDILIDATKDTVYLVPFLFVVYLLMEWIEHRAGDATVELVRKAGAAGPLVGALLGSFPQCGFSAAGATLYAGRVITLGTLFAVLLSTSDELLPVMIAEQAPVEQMLAILGVKVVVGMVMGFAVDLALRIRRRQLQKLAPDQPVPVEPLAIHELCAQDHCHCSGGCATCESNPEAAYQHDKVLAECACEHEHEHQHTASHILRSAVKHTLQVTVFIWLVSLVLGAVLELAGEDALGQAIASVPALSVLVSALVGLIPNCAASVAIIQLYLDGVLGAGAMLAGLLSAAGVGLLVLCRSNRRPKQNLAIIGILYAIAVVWGLLFQLTGIVL